MPPPDARTAGCRRRYVYATPLGRSRNLPFRSTPSAGEHQLLLLPRLSVHDGVLAVARRKDFWFGRAIIGSKRAFCATPRRSKARIRAVSAKRRRSPALRHSWPGLPRSAPTRAYSQVVGAAAAVVNSCPFPYTWPCLVDTGSGGLSARASRATVRALSAEGHDDLAFLRSLTKLGPRGRRSVVPAPADSTATQRYKGVERE